MYSAATTVHSVGGVIQKEDLAGLVPAKSSFGMTLTIEHELCTVFAGYNTHVNWLWAGGLEGVLHNGLNTSYTSLLKLQCHRVSCKCVSVCRLYRHHRSTQLIAEMFKCLGIEY